MERSKVWYHQKLLILIFRFVEKHLRSLDFWKIWLLPWDAPSQGKVAEEVWEVLFGVA